jgi:hypothetical protein
MGREPDIHFEFPKRFEIEILERLRHGVDWQTGQLAWDDLALLGYEGDVLRLSGFDAPANDLREFTVDLRTGQTTDKPYS